MAYGRKYTKSAPGRYEWRCPVDIDGEIWMARAVVRRLESGGAWTFELDAINGPTLCWTDEIFRTKAAALRRAFELEFARWRSVPGLERTYRATYGGRSWEFSQQY